MHMQNHTKIGAKHLYYQRTGLWGIFEVNNWCMRAWPTVDGAIHEQVVLRYMENSSRTHNKERVSMHCSFMVLSLLLLKFLSCLPSVMTCEGDMETYKPHPTKLLLIMMFTTARKKANPGHFLMDIGDKNPDAERNKCSEFPVYSWILLNCLFLSYKQDLKFLVKDVFCIWIPTICRKYMKLLHCILLWNF